VLGAQVAVAFNHVGATRGQLEAGACDESPLCLNHSVSKRLPDAGAEPVQDCAICTYVRAQPAQVRVGRCGMRLGVAKEAVQPLDEPLPITAAEVASLQRLNEHRAAGQTTHLEQIILDAHADAKLQCSGAIDRQHFDRLIHAARQTPVEPEFLTASARARRQRAVVHAGMAQRLLELVRIPRCQKQPGEMGLDSRDPRGPIRITAAITQKLQLLRKRRPSKL